MAFVKKYIFNKYNIIRIIIGFAIGVAVSLLNVAAVNGWTQANCYKNGFFLGAFVCVLIGLLSVLANFGSFNIFSYFPGRKTFDGHKETYTQYSERKNLERDKSKFAFIIYLVDALVLVIFALISILFN